MSKNRKLSKQGENHHLTKFTDTDIKKIHKALEDGQDAHSIATKYHVKYETIRKIRSGENWPHLHRPLALPTPTVGIFTRSSASEIRQKIKTLNNRILRRKATIDRVNNDIDEIKNIREVLIKKLYKIEKHLSNKGSA